MDSVNEARHSSLLETKTFMVASTTIWTGDGPITDENTAFNLILDEISKQKQIHLEVLIGYAIDKSNKEHNLINDLLFILPNIRTWASRPAVNLPAVKGKASRSESDIQRLSDTILLDFAKDIQKLITDNPAVVDPVYIPTARNTLFNSNITAFENVVEMPSTMRDIRAAATTAMKAGIKLGMTQRRDTFLDAIRRKRESEPAFFNSFKQSMKLDGNPRRKLSFIGNVSEEDTGGTGSRGGRAIANVRCFIPELGKEVKTGEMGNFIFKSLLAGEYVVLFTKYGYEPVTATIAVNDGERTEKTITMKIKIFPA